jgi:glycosyltransferase involved in cell wall biosynthesis
MDPRSGGPSTSLRHLAAMQAQCGHTVSILTTDAQSAEPWWPDSIYRQQLLNDEQLQQVKLIIAKGVGRTRPLSRFRYSKEAHGIIDGILESSREHPDVVHVHGLFSHVTMSAARQARHWNIPFVLRPAGGLNALCRRHGNALGKSVLYRLWERRNLMTSHFVQATSQREKDELRHLLPHKRIEIVPHGTTIPSLDNNNYNREVFFRKFPQLEGRRIVLFLSRLASKKRLDLLIEAVARLRTTMPEVALAIAGPDAGYKQKTISLIRKKHLEDHAFFLGFLTGSLKEGAFSAASFLALPSEDENFGLVVVEAMAHGLPVLVSEGVDSHTYVKQARAGVVVRSTVNSVFNGMEKLFAADLERVGARGRQFAAGNLSWEKIVHQLDAYYGHSR